MATREDRRFVLEVLVEERVEIICWRITVPILGELPVSSICLDVGWGTCQSIHMRDPTAKLHATRTSGKDMGKYIIFECEM